MIKKRVKALLIIFLLAIAMVLTVGCSKNQKDNEKESVSQTTADKAEDGETKETEDLEGDEGVDNKVEINIASLKGPTSMGLVKIMEDNENDKGQFNYNFTIAGTADEITAGIVNGDYDMAAIPANLASVLYNKSEGKVVVAGINTLGVLYIVETGEEIKSVEDLKGKTIYSTGKGTTPEYTLNYLLASKGIDVDKDLTIEYKSESTEVAALLNESDNAIAMLPQPYVTTVMMNNDKIRIALDVAKEWEKADDGDSAVTTGVIVINKKFLEENKELVNDFLDDYKNSVDYVNENIKDAASLIEKFDIFKAVVAEKAIPDCNITLITGDGMKSKLSGYLNVLHEQNPNSVGGQLPKDDFYYIP